MEKQTTQKRVIGYLFGLHKVSPVLTRLMLITQVLATILMTAIAPIFVSKLLTNIANGSATLDSSMSLLISYAIIMFIGNVVIFRFSIAMIYISETKMGKFIATSVFKHLTEKSLGYHANKMSGGIISDASKLNGAYERFWDNLTFTAVPIITTIVSICIALSFIMWQYAIVLALLSITIIAIIIKSQIILAPTSAKVAKQSSKMTAYFADTISNVSAVKAFAREKSELKHFTKHFDNYRFAVMKEMKGVLVVTGVMSTMMTLMNVVAFVAAIFATEYQIANIGAIYLVVNYTFSVVSQLWQVSSTTRTYIRIIGDASPMIGILDEPIEIKDPINPSPLIINLAKINFNNIKFTHDENEKALFDNFNLSINPGEQVGLIGKSGSGKTSLARLLLRFSDIENGEITIDDQNIANVKQSALHKAIAYVSQEPTLFHRSIRDNIAYGKPNANDNEILEAARKANALDFIKALPKGLDTTIGERGVKLSGGQRQRIAIARAILKDAPILVLDEASSALDSESEQLIQGALSKLMKGRTSIVIAHRLSTIAKLDRIVVLDDGKITEQGTHNELITNNGIYSKLWSHQSGGFIKE